MKRVKPFCSTIVAVASQLALLTCASAVMGQITFQRGNAGTSVRKFKPFTDVRGQMPSWVTKKALKSSRAGVVPQTEDLTAGTPLVSDTNPYGTKDEQTIVFQSDRGDLAGKTLATDGLTHIYTMSTGGSSLVALTGPLSSSGLGKTTSQSYGAYNDNETNLVYVDTDATGTVDLIELVIATGVPNKILSQSTDFQFAAVQHPRYCVTSLGFGIVFAGRLKSATNFNLFFADPVAKHVVQMTTGAADDRNPAISPDGKVIAFDSDRASPGQGQRDVWVIGTSPNATPRRVTNFLTSSNIEPAWSSLKPFPYRQIPIPLLMFASTRMDSKGDGNADTAVNPNGSHDLYRLPVKLAQDPSNASLETIVNPVDSSTATVEDAATNPGLKQNTSDPQHVYDDRNPNWPQQSATFRAFYQSDRTSFDPSAPLDQSASGPNHQPPDIFSSDMLDLNAPTLVRYSDATGEIVHVSPRQGIAGQPVTIAVKVADFESGIRDVWVQIKNPNSKYQSLDNLEHKVFLFWTVTPNNTDLMTAPLEWESEPIDPVTGTYPRRNTKVATAPEYIAGFADNDPFSGEGVPDANARWIKLGNPVRDTATGYWTYSTTWTTPTTPSDYIIDVIAFDNAQNPFGGGSSNWKIYDNVWGFSTLPFAQQQSILYVSDYTQGQKFFYSQFGQANQLGAVNQSFWGCESWLTDIDVSYLPNSYQEIDSTGKVTVNGSLRYALNAMGVKSYGTPFLGVRVDGGGTLDGTTIDGQPYPITQRYDVWRILCRGPVPDYVLREYLPTSEIQPSDTPTGSPRRVLVSRNCVIWHAPYTGDVFASPGSLVDTATQSQLDAFLAAGGRLFVDGQDIAWALTLDGLQANSFVSSDLKVSYVADVPPTQSLLGDWVSNGPAPLYNTSYASLFKLDAGDGGAANPISGDPWYESWSIGISPGHQYPYITVANNAIAINNPDYVYQGVDLIAGNLGATVDARTYADVGGAALPDVVTAGADTTVDLKYGGTANPALMHYPNLSVESAAGYNTEPLGGRRLVFSPTGIEGFNPGWSSVTFTSTGATTATSIGVLKNRIAEIMHNIVCWFRTGTIRGTILSLEGSTPMANVFVRAVDALGRTAYTAITNQDGVYSMNGVRPGGFSMTAQKAGFAVQRPVLARPHGLTTDVADFRMTTISPATVSGIVYKSDGKTPLAGATLNMQDNLDKSNALTTTSGSDGTYTFERVPAGTTYTLTCTATGFGASTPPQYTVPNPNDPIISQRDATIVGGKSYIGFNFNMSAQPGGATGQVVVDNSANDPNFPPDGTGIGGATVTATQGSTTVTAVADSSGNYSFSSANSTPNGLDPGNWILVASAPGYLPNIGVSVTVTSGTSVVAPTIKLKPAPPGSLSGLVTRAADGLPLVGVTLSIADQNGKALGGVSPVVSGAVQTNGSYKFNYKFPSVPAGATVLVTATLAGYKATAGTSNPVSATVVSGKETQGINFQLDAMHTFSSGTTLVSAPYDYSSTDVATVLGVADLTKFGFFWWDPTGMFYRAYPDAEASRFRLGQGYFLRYPTPLPVTVTGNPASREQTFAIPLHAGWTAIGNPFPPDDTGAGINVDWTKVAVQTTSATLAHDQAVAQGVIGSGIYTYILNTPVLDFSINTWQGYFIRTYQDCVLLLDPINDVATRAVATRAVESAVLQGKSGWTVNLQAHSADAKDETNYLGVAAGATDGFDGFKAEKPPVFGDRYVRVTFDHADWAARSGSYGVDVRSSAPTPHSWDVSVTTNVSKGPVTLSWPNTAKVGRNWTVTLTDLTTNTVRDLRTSSSYTWQSSGQAEVRKFRITATATHRNAVLRITQVAARQTRSAGLNVSYNLSVPADVELRVLGSTGHVVRNIGTQTGRAAGVSEATWDGRNNQGVMVPAGLYQVEIRAQTSDGQTVKQVAPVVIAR